jgi:hypothetical protein
MWIGDRSSVWGDKNNHEAKLQNSIYAKKVARQKTIINNAV